MSLYRSSMYLCALCVLCNIYLFAADDDVPITVQKLSDRLINLRVGDIPISGEVIVNNVAALLTDEGVIVFDTGYYPQTAYRLRTIIEKEFGTSEIAFVVNTHWHWDHINGNQAFEDVPIIGHEKIIPVIDEWKSGLDDFIKQRKERVQHWTETLSRAKPGTEEYITANGWSWAHARFLEEYEQGFKVVLPNITFREKLQFGGAQNTVVMLHLPFHSDHDVIVHIPGEKALIIGDVFFPGYLPRISPDLVQHLPDVIGKLKSIIETGTVETVIPGHKRLLDANTFTAFVNYLDSLWNEVNDHKEKGIDLSTTKELLKLDEKFNWMASLDGLEFHEKNIEIIWNYLDR